MDERDDPTFQALSNQRLLSRRSFVRGIGAGAGLALVSGLVAACSGGASSPSAAAGSTSLTATSSSLGVVATPATVADTPIATVASAPAASLGTPARSARKKTSTRSGGGASPHTVPAVSSGGDTRSTATWMDNRRGPAWVPRRTGTCGYACGSNVVLAISHSLAGTVRGYSAVARASTVKRRRARAAVARPKLRWSLAPRSALREKGPSSRSVRLTPSAMRRARDSFRETPSRAARLVAR